MGEGSSVGATESVEGPAASTWEVLVVTLDLGPGALSAVRYVATLGALCWLVRQWWLARTSRLE